jgi:5-methylthioadenosine/S-adenosylhomocysteine deaminase
MRRSNFLLIFTIIVCLSTATFAQKTALKIGVDMIVRGGTVVTMDAGKKMIGDGAVAVKGGKIVAVDTTAAIDAKYSSKQIVNARGKLVIPGLINTHTHVPMSLFRHLGNDLDLQQWLQQYIFPGEAKNVNEAFVRAGTRLGLAEMIRGGTTTYCDMYYFEDAIADETQKAGMRGVLGETVIDFPVPDNKTFAQGLAYSETFIKKWQGNKLITPAIAPHAPYTVSEANLKSADALSKRLNSPLLIHLAEAPTETEAILKQTGIRPIAYLAKIGLLNDRLIAAHVVHANDEELALLKTANVGIGHNPQSNMKLASGVSPVPAMLSMGMRVGLGTDGAASNNDVNMWEEMDSAAKMHKLYSKDPKVASAAQMFEMATIGGARALHMEDQIGSLEAGKRADIVIVDTDALNQVPGGDLLANAFSILVYATKATDVRSVIIEGRLIMRDRALLTLNEPAIKAEAVQFRKKIDASLQQK